MARYTIELGTLLSDPDFELFDFDYDFYLADTDTVKMNKRLVSGLQLKKRFEDKFKTEYFFNEIGQETVCRFKVMLKNALDKNMDYYKELFESKIKASTLDLSLNKDYREEFTRTVENAVDSSFDSSNHSTDSSISNSKGNKKDSSINNGLADIGLGENYLTTVAEAKNDDTQNTVADSKDAGTSTTSGTTTETTVLEAKGNIGSVTGAYMIQQWRDIIVNIDELIIEDCRNCFMAIY